MRIAYIAPELPGLSSTFVYKEIFALEELDIAVLPFSIHQNLTGSDNTAVNKLKNRTQILYEKPIARLFIDNLTTFLGSPFRYLYCICLAIIDSFHYVHKPRVAFGILYRFFQAGSLARDIVKNDVLHIHAHFAHFPTDIAMYAGIITDVPFSFTAHANDIFVNYWLLQQKVQRSKFVATISEFNIDYLDKLGCDSRKIRLIRCGVDGNDYPTTLTKSPNAPIKLGFLGRLVEKKGATVLLHACKRLKDSKIDFRLEILGDGPLSPELKFLAEELNLQDEVEFRGKVDNTEVFPWLNSIDIFILPAQKDSQGDMDGIPVALMEAILCDTAVISTALSGIPELVRHNETGLLAIPGDSTSLAENIELLIKSSSLQSELSKNAKLLVNTEFNSNINAERLHSLFLADVSS